MNRSNRRLWIVLLLFVALMIVPQIAQAQTQSGIVCIPFTNQCYSAPPGGWAHYVADTTVYFILGLGWVLMLISG